MVPALHWPTPPETACPHGLRLRAQRDGHAQLEPRLRGQTRRTATHPEAAQPYKDDILHFVIYAQRRTRAARWARAPRTLLRILLDRHTAPQKSS